jgi:hypothetical protein
MCSTWPDGSSACTIKTVQYKVNKSLYRIYSRIKNITLKLLKSDQHKQETICIKILLDDHCFKVGLETNILETCSIPIIRVDMDWWSEGEKLKYSETNLPY